ncbi:adenine deaminase [Metabacillus sp. 84]|uniref:adenine deaminase n=1 Tax=unclassified Metabacillus TaxID=2675274 RepID=UPI003CF820BD
MFTDDLNARMEAAAGDGAADLVMLNVTVADVFSHEWMKADVAIKNGEFVGFNRMKSDRVVNGEGMYMIPSFIDSHVHIESSMVAPPEFAKVVLPHGVTTVIADPHEIANVAGGKGIQFMLDQSENLPLDVRIMLPSSVPAVSFEENGAVLAAEDLKAFTDHPRVLGLAEIMDYPSLVHREKQMLDKLALARGHNMPIDGHLAGLSHEMIDLYRTSGVRTDHEVTTAEEAIARISRGMYVQIRQGSVARNLPAVIKAVTLKNSRRFIFCTDDKHLDELQEEGSIDHLVRLSIQSGIEPLTVFQMASLNAAECYGLSKKGAIAPGYEADFILTDDVENLQVRAVYRLGKEIAADGKITAKDWPVQTKMEEELLNTVKMDRFSKKNLNLEIQPERNVPIIRIIPNELVTIMDMEKTNSQNRIFIPDTGLDHLKLVCADRYRADGKTGTGIVKGFRLKRGAIAASISHDSHNIMALGTNDDAIYEAIVRLQEMNGGMAVADEDGSILASLPLPVGGLMSCRRYEEVIENMAQVHKALQQIGFKEAFNPFVMMSFLALPVIPEIKLTVNGLFQVNEFKWISY